jgi:TolB-like protein
MRTVITTLAVASVIALGGCGGMGATTFVHPAFDFGYIERVAVVPFENISNDQGAGARAFRYFTNALLASESFEVVEPGEVARALEKQAFAATAQLTEQQSMSLGRELAAQGIFLGSVSESARIRSGSRSVTVITVVIRLVETETGATVWSAANTEDSSSFWSSLFGTQQKSSSEVMRRCIEGCLDTLFD